jgi:hypothetical protein
MTPLRGTNSITPEKEAWGRSTPRQGGPCTPSVDAKEVTLPYHEATSHARVW